MSSADDKTAKGHARWRELEELFAALVTLDPAARNEALAGLDPDLRGELESLLKAHEHSSSSFPGRAAFIAAVEELALSGQETQVRESDGMGSVIGRRIGVYRIVRLIGQGGMGAVYQAVRADGEFEKRVAVKLIRSNVGARALMRRFRQERQILAALDHPFIAKLLDGGTTEDGFPYFIMEHVDGQSLDVYCDEHGLSVRARLKVFLDVCRAVQFAHQNLIVHRDLKPSNILISSEGSPKLLDFGIAKLLRPQLFPDVAATRFGERPMTPEYASPEQFQGASVTIGTDVYSLGVILYRLLTGRHPYDLSNCTSLAEVEKIVCERQPSPPSLVVRESDGERAGTVRGSREKLARRLRTDLDNIVLVALRKEPQRRYGSVQEFAEDIRRHLGGLPVRAVGDSFSYRSRKFVQRHKLSVTTVTAISVLLLGLGTSIWVSSNRIARESARVEAINEFLLETLAAPDPYEGKGRNVTVFDLLEQSRPDVNTRFAEEPEIRAAVQHTLGVTYGRLGDLGEAARQLTSALKLRRSHLGHQHPETVRTSGELAVVREQEGRYREAESLLRSALTALSPRGNEGDLALTLQQNLASVLQQKGQYEEAEHLYRQVLEARRRAVGEHHLDFAASLNNLASVLDDKGDYRAAAGLYDQSLSVYRSLVGPEHPYVATVLNNVASLAMAQGDYERAENLFQQALEIDRQALGTEHPAVARDLNQMGLLMGERGKLPEAESLLREALAMNQEAFGSEHPWIVDNLTSLGVIAQEEGSYSKAEELYRQALDMGGRVMSEVHPHLGNLYSNLGNCAFSRGDFQQAERYFRHGLSVYREAFSDEHPLTLRIENNLVTALYYQGDLETAESLVRENLSTAEKIFGPVHPEVGAALDLLGSILQAQGDLEAARPVLERALEVRRKIYGEEHYRVIESLNNLAALNGELEQYSKAEKLYREALAIERRLDGEDKVTTGTILGNLAWVLRSRGEPENALPLYEEALRVLSQALGTEHWRVALFRGGYGACLSELGRYREAEQPLLFAYERLRETFGQEDARTQKALRRVVDLYEQAGRSSEAESYRKRLADMGG